MRRFIAVDDCGVRINPMIVDGQIHGGLAEGIGIALMEVITFDDDGNCLNSSFMDYLIPTALECPDFELGETVTPCPHHPLGAKGVGESPNVGSPPAIVNAVIDALHETHGVDHIDMPCSPGAGLGRDAGAPRAAAVSPREVTGEAAGELRHLAPDVETLARRLAEVDYLVDEGLATAMFLGLRLPQPLLLEGEAGVGKTEAGKALAAVLDTPLIRLQCYDGIDATEALYEWNYPRQLLSIRLADANRAELSEDDLFGPDYLIRRPLLRALEHPGPRPAVLLIDEIDRADDDFEAFLLELLGEAAVTIPELGTIRATHPPVIVLTSNRTRDLHDAVKRRCLYRWIDYPTPEREVEIVRRRVKGTSESLAVQVVRAVARMRDSRRAEAARDRRGDRLARGARAARRRRGSTRPRSTCTLGSVLKYGEDQDVVRAAGLDQLVGSGG